MHFSSSVPQDLKGKERKKKKERGRPFPRSHLFPSIRRKKKKRCLGKKEEKKRTYHSPS